VHLGRMSDSRERSRCCHMYGMHGNIWGVAVPPRGCGIS
jgi:hypothetical protein